jgi:hypothetical protein
MPEAAAQLETRLEKRYREPVLWARIDVFLHTKKLAGGKLTAEKAHPHWAGKAPNSKRSLIDSPCANVYAFYKPLRVGSNCSSSYVRLFIPALPKLIRVTTSASFPETVV